LKNLIKIEDVLINPEAFAFAMPTEEGGTTIYFQGVPTTLTSGVSSDRLAHLLLGGE